MLNNLLAQALRRAHFLLLLPALALLASTAQAQSATGSLAGIVTDERGAAVAGALITVTDIAKAVEKKIRHKQ